MHEAINRGQILNVAVVNMFIHPELKDKFPKTAIVRKFNNLKRTNEIITH